MIYRILILFISTVVLLGCSKQKHDERLSSIADLVSESPTDALYGLDSINYKDLSDFRVGLT